MEGRTFEELCRAHIQAFAKGAEKFATQTRLSKHVGDWHERLAPILEEEERRPEFNIHAYAQRVVDTIVDSQDMTKGKPIVSFELITKECPRYEVCRLFLASLSLANSCNIGLELDDEDSTLHIALLDDSIKNPMKDYLAPSLVDHD